MDGRSRCSGADAERARGREERERCVTGRCAHRLVGAGMGGGMARVGRWVLGLAGLLLLAGCAVEGASRRTVDIQTYAMCLRTGGQWWPYEQFGGNCIYQGKHFP